MDGERVHPDLRRTADAGRRARGPVRQTAAVHGRTRRLHGRLGRGGPLPGHRGTHRLPGGPGRGSGDHDAVDAHPDRRRRPARAAGSGTGRLRGGDRGRGRQWPADRRRAHRAHLLAVDLLAERADRTGAAAAGPAAAHRVLRAEGAPGHPRHGPGQRGPLRHRLRPGQHREPRMDRSRRPDRADRGHGAARPVRPARHPGGEPDAADAAVPQPGLPRDQRREPADVPRDVRIDLPAQPVPAERPRTLAHRGRVADAALDGDADTRGALRRVSLRPLRGPPGGGHRARAPGRRTLPVRPDHRARGELHRPAPRPDHRWGRHGHVLRARREPGALQRPARGTGHRLRSQQRAAGGRRGARGRGPRRRLRRAGRLRLTAAVRGRHGARHLDRGRCGGPGRPRRAPDPGRRSAGHPAPEPVDRRATEPEPVAA